MTPSPRSVGFLARLMNPWSRPRGVRSPNSAVGDGAGRGVPAAGRRGALRYVIACATLLAGAGVLRGLNADAVPMSQPLQGLPAALGPWQGETDYFDADTVASLRVDDYILRRYYQTSNSIPVWLYVGYWGAQRLGQERIHSPSVCLPGAGWVIARSGVTGIQVGDRTIQVNNDLITKDGQQQLVIYWYQIHGRVVAKELPATATLAWTSLTEHHSDEALVRINAPVVGSINDTLAREVSFVRTAFPALAQRLPD